MVRIERVDREARVIYFVTAPPPCKDRAGADLAGKPIDPLAPRGVDHTRAPAGIPSPLSPTTVIGRGR